MLAVTGDNNKVLDTGSLSPSSTMKLTPPPARSGSRRHFPTKDLQLWPGQFINTRLLLITRTNGIGGARHAVIQRGPTGSYAFVIDNGN